MTATIRILMSIMGTSLYVTHLLVSLAGAMSNSLDVIYLVVSLACDIYKY